MIRSEIVNQLRVPVMRINSFPVPASFNDVRRIHYAGYLLGLRIALEQVREHVKQNPEFHDRPLPEWFRDLEDSIAEV